MATRCLAILILSVSLLTGAACDSSAVSPSSTPPRNVTLTFSGLTAGGAPVTIYSESGFSVSADPGGWVVWTGYGNPAPFIQFGAPAGNVVTGQISVTADQHAAFSFKSVDLYSSTTQIPYIITGVKDDTIVFTVADRLPNTFGNFRTVVNPHGSDVIDAIIISLSNPAALCCSNPMGVDNVVLSQ
jgi:hypothetical protein